MKEIIVKIKGKNVKLKIDEANKLYENLVSLLEKNKIIIFVPYLNFEKITFKHCPNITTTTKMLAYENN